MMKRVVVAVLLLSSIGLNAQQGYKEHPNGWIQFDVDTGVGYFSAFQKEFEIDEDYLRLQILTLPTMESCLSAIQITSTIEYDPNFVFDATNMACGLATDKRLDMVTMCQTQSDGTNIGITYSLDQNSKEEGSRILEAIARDNELVFTFGNDEYKFSLKGSAHVVNLIKEGCRISN